MASSRFAEFQNSAPQSVIAEHQNSAPESIAAEYQHSAPESVEPPKFAEHDVDTAPQFHFNDDPRSAPEVVMSSEKELLGFDEDVPKKRRFCGLAKSTVIILVLVAVVVVVGAVVGGVLATRNTRQATTTQKPSPTSPSTQSGTTTTPTPTPTPTAITIKSAIYGAADVTDVAQRSFPQGAALDVNMSATTDWNVEDPWPDVRKCLSLLHSFGDSIRTFIACDGTGNFDLVPGNVGLSPNTQEITTHAPNSTDFTIVSVVWGLSEIRDKAVDQVLWEYKQNGSAMLFESSLFGNKDSMPNNLKSGIIWYTEDDFKTFKSVSAKEGDSAGF